MLRKLLISMVIVSAFIGKVTATEFTQGDYYVEIEGNITKNKEIREFFSFYCPHCYNQEPLMNDLKASMPDDATFKKNHVDSMPGQSIEIEQALTKALITADILKVKEKVVPAIFERIHIKRAKFDSKESIKDLFLTHGVDSNTFDKTFNSFSVNVQFKKMQKNTTALRQQGITTVPTLIINGIYKPVTDKIKSIEEYKALILFLLNKTA